MTSCCRDGGLLDGEARSGGPDLARAHCGRRWPGPPKGAPWSSERSVRFKKFQTHAPNGNSPTSPTFPTATSQSQSNPFVSLPQFPPIPIERLVSSPPRLPRSLVVVVVAMDPHPTPFAGKQAPTSAPRPPQWLPLSLSVDEIDPFRGLRREAAVGCRRAGEDSGAQAQVHRLHAHEDDEEVSPSTSTATVRRSPAIHIEKSSVRCVARLWFRTFAY